MSLLRFDLDTQRELHSSLPRDSPTSFHLFYLAFPTRLPLLSLRIARDPRSFHLVLGKPTVFRVSPRFLLFSPPSSPFFFRDAARIIELSRGTFTRSLNRANDKRLFRLYRWLTDRTIISVGARVQRVLRYRIFDYD